MQASAKVTRLGSIRWCGHISFGVCKLKQNNYYNNAGHNF